MPRKVLVQRALDELKKVNDTTVVFKASKVETVEDTIEISLSELYASIRNYQKNIVSLNDQKQRYIEKIDAQVDEIKEQILRMKEVIVSAESKGVKVEKPQDKFDLEGVENV